MTKLRLHKNAYFTECEEAGFDLRDEFEKDGEIDIDQEVCPFCNHGCNYCLMTSW